MSFDPHMIQPFRDELTEIGIKELHTGADVENELRSAAGTTMVVINSVCGCAAGKARPGGSSQRREGQCLHRSVRNGRCPRDGVGGR